MAPTLSCHICQRQDFDKNASLVLHYYQSHEAIFCCQYCSHQFCTGQERDVHLNKHHASPAAFSCIFCDVRSRQKKEMTHHQKEYHPVAVKDFTCPKCDIILPDKESFNIHNDFCRGKPKAEETRGRQRSASEGRGPQASTPKAIKPDSDGASFVCQYCPQQFSNRDDHCRHLIFVHQAGVMCSYCNTQLIAPPGDQAASSKVFKEHLEREHKSARHWVCIYCGITVNDRQALVNHQENARHRLMSCHLCSALMPSHTAQVLHKEFQHKFTSDASSTDQPARNNTASTQEGLCLCCFRRYPMGNLRQHLLQHVERECEWISCNECFSFIQHPAELDKHMPCFEREAKRFSAYMAGDKSTLSLCHCGFCAGNHHQLTRHNGWCHKELSCVSCKETEFGFVGMKRHMCMAPNGRGRHGTVAQLAERPSGSPRIPRESGTPRSSQAESMTNGGLLLNQPPLPVAPQTAADAATGSGLALELPDSPEEITIKEEQNETALAARSATAESAQQTKTVPAQAKKAQETPRPRNDSTSSSSSSSSDDATTKTTPAPVPVPKKTAPAKRPLEKKKTPLSEKQAQKRPRVQSKPASSESSSSSSSDSEDERPVATRPKPKVPTPAAARKKTMAPNHGSTSSSSTSSSDDDEDDALLRSKSGRASNKTTPSDGRPKITSVFSIKDAEAVAKRKSANGTSLKTPPARQNVFAAAANGHKESVEPAVRAGTSKRKTVEETHNAADLEYMCVLCNQASIYRANVIRHLEIIHRIRQDMCSEFCQTRERPQQPIDDDEEEEQEQSSTRTIGVEAKKTCLDCKLWQKKVQSMEKILAKMYSQIDKARKLLKEEQNE